jgi:hypothetical protein
MTMDLVFALFMWAALVAACLGTFKVGGDYDDAP